jgi:competence protein ComEA
MIQRPLYQAALALLTIVAAAGGIWLWVGTSSSPGVEVTIVEHTSAAQSLTTDNASGPTARDLININTATIEEMETLPKIGPVLAQRIVAYRERHGPFQRADQVMVVERIGPAVYEAIRYLVTVGE